MLPGNTPHRIPTTFRTAPAGCSPHPQPRTQAKKAHERSHHRFTENSDLPCAMVYGLFRALLGDRALLPPSLADRSANLTPASGRQDHTSIFWYSVKHAETKKTL